MRERDWGYREWEEGQIKSLRKACLNRKDDYLCTPLNSKSRITNEWGFEMKGLKKESLKFFTQTLVRNENLITFAPRLTKEYESQTSGFRSWKEKENKV